MATINPVRVDYTGYTRPASGTSVTSSDKFPNDGRTILSIVNGGAATTVKIKNEEVPRPGVAKTVLDETVTVAANSTVSVGPFVPGWFNDEDGFVNFEPARTSDVSVYVLNYP